MNENNPEAHGKVSPAVKEVHIIWITAGLSCDGDSVSVTAAIQPWQTL